MNNCHPLLHSHSNVCMAYACVLCVRRRYYADVLFLYKDMQNLHIYIFVCMYVYVYVCMYVCVYVYICVYVHILYIWGFIYCLW